MQVNSDEIRRTLALLFHAGDTIELRCVGSGKTINGYYRDPQKLASDACRLNQDFSPQENVYICLNPVQPELYARRADQFGAAAKGAGTKDPDIACRRWLLIDIDPVRPAGVSATGRQKQAASELARQVYAWLREQLGSSSIVCADSGNGAHMLLRLPDLPADDQARWTCERLLQLLDRQFSNTQAKVDCTTFNAARICTLYGTVKRKGSDIAEQPHRLSRLLHVPDQLQPAEWQRLVALVEQHAGQQPQQTAPQPASAAIGNGQAVDRRSHICW